MSALRKPQIEEQSSPEVIYLLVPPASDQATVSAKPEGKPWTPIERVAFAYWQFRLRTNETPVAKVVRAVGLATGYVVMGLPLLYGAYCFKSFLGLDIFPNSHLGDFIPALQWRGGSLL